MSFFKRAGIVAVALAGLFALPSVADAAYATASVNQRTGPGTGYAVITTIPAGAHVAVHSCPTSWCNVTYAGITGWVSGSYIGHSGAYVSRPAVVVQPSVSLEFSFGERDRHHRYLHHDRRYAGHFDRNDRRYVRKFDRNRPPKYIAQPGKLNRGERFAEQPSRPQRNCRIPGRCEGPG